MASGAERRKERSRNSSPCVVRYLWRGVAKLWRLSMPLVLLTRPIKSSRSHCTFLSALASGERRLGPLRTPSLARDGGSAMAFIILRPLSLFHPVDPRETRPTGAHPPSHHCSARVDFSSWHILQYRGLACRFFCRLHAGSNWGTIGGVKYVKGRKVTRDVTPKGFVQLSISNDVDSRSKSKTRIRWPPSPVHTHANLHLSSK